MKYNRTTTTATTTNGCGCTRCIQFTTTFVTTTPTNINGKIVNLLWMMISIFVLSSMTTTVHQHNNISIEQQQQQYSCFMFVMGQQQSTTTTTTEIDYSTQLKQYIGIERTLPHDGLLRWFVEYPPPPPPNISSLSSSTAESITTTNSTTTATTGNTTSTTTTPTSTTKVPVVILLHYGTGNMHSSRIFGRTLEKDPWLKIAQEYGLLVLSPNAASPRWFGNGYNTKRLFGTSNDWNDLLGGRNQNVAAIDDVGFISALVDWSIQERNGDPKRIYLYGFSNGGTMVHRMLIERPNMFAAAAAVAANLPEFDIPYPSHGTPIFIMCGTKDNRMPYDGGRTGLNQRNYRGMVRSAEATRDYFVTANQAVGSTMMMIETTLPDIDPNDNCRIVSQYYYDGQQQQHNVTTNSPPVQYYKLDGGGHNFAGVKTVVFGTPNIEFPPFVNYIISLVLGNPCYDADGILLAWEFMSNFTLQ